MTVLRPCLLPAARLEDIDLPSDSGGGSLYFVYLGLPPIYPGFDAFIPRYSFCFYSIGRSVQAERPSECGCEKQIGSSLISPAFGALGAARG